MRSDWSKALDALTPERRRAMEFLYRHLPESDLDCYSPALFLQFADHALALRKEAPWCAELDREIFDHYVLFPRINDEDLSFHRGLFHDALWPRIQNCASQADRILAVNRWCHETASYQAQDERTASPLTVFRGGVGRCGEESAFLAAALRSVGIAARQVYVPRWAHCDDNHAWVEALCDGAWRFLGACEPEPVLDLGWFNAAASRAILVHSRLFGPGASPLHGEFLCQEGGVRWYNQTARYAPVRACTFRALRDGKPAIGAVFQIQILNEAAFHTVAALTADGQGEARASLGIGDFHVTASLDGLWAEGDCTNGALTLHLAPPEARDTGWEPFDVHAPQAAQKNTAALNAEQRKQRAAALRRGDILRASRFPQPEDGPWRDLLQAAKGNAGKIAAFLARDGDPRREAILRSISAKDLRDVTAAVLEDHLQNAPAPGDTPPEVYLSYVLCPRIELEPLTPWRGLLREVLAEAPAHPADLWTWLNKRMDLTLGRTYSNLVWTPAEAWRARRCDRRSLALLYVALLRTRGVPARLRTLDGAPEFWADGAFRLPWREETGSLRLGLTGESWSLSRWTETGWKLLHPDGGTAVLSAGRYRLITSTRLPNGSQWAAKRELVLAPGAEVSANLVSRTYSLADALRCQALPAMPAVTLDGQAVPDLCQAAGRPALLLWLEEGREPTEHVLNELTAGQAALEALPLEVVFLLRGPDSLRHPALANLLERWPEIRVLLDDWAYDLETVARHLTCDPSAPPLAVVCDQMGRAVYGVSGYHVGSVALLTKIAAYLCETERG